MGFFAIIPFIIYFALIGAFLYAIYNISKNSTHQTQILQEILKELKIRGKDKQEDKSDQL